MELVIEAVLGAIFWIAAHPIVTIAFYLITSLIAEIFAIVLKRSKTRFWKIPFIVVLSGYVTLPLGTIIWTIRLAMNIRSLVAKRLADGRFEDRGVERK